MPTNMTTASEKKWRLLRTYLARRPLWCAWQVTYRCNFRCRFCHYWADPMGRQPEQTVEQFALGARKLARWGTLLISLAGGEPLLRRDIVDVVSAVGKWHFPFLTTNGHKANPDLAKDLFAAGLWGVSVSLDYADADRHNQARGVSDAYERALHALECFSQARRYPWQRVNVMAVLLDDNLEEMERLIQLAASYDAYFMVQPYSVMKTGSQRYRPSHKNGVSKHLLGLRRHYTNFLSNPYFLSQFDHALNGGVPGCAAGHAFFNIDSTGDIAICVEERKHPVANLYRDDPTTIIQQLRAASANNHCRKCWYNCRGEVESLYNMGGLLRSLPTLLFDQGRPAQQDKPAAKIVV